MWQLEHSPVLSEDHVAPCGGASLTRTYLLCRLYSLHRGVKWGWLIGFAGLVITFSDLKVCLAYAQQLPSYSIGVYYFGYWSPEFPKSQLDHYRSHFSGRADWCAGVRDLFQSADGTGGALYKGDFKHLKPSI